MTNIISKIKATVKDALFKHQLKRLYDADAKYQMRYLRGLAQESKDKSDAEIMLVMHALEKGMSFKVKKKGFGKEKSSALVDLLNKHLISYGVDDQVAVATNILHGYLQDAFSVEDIDVRKKIEDYLSEHKDLLKESTGGAKSVTKPVDILSYEDVLRLYSSRVSVREYSNQPLSKEEIDKAINLARTSPSACNRQAARVYVVKDEQLKRSIMDNQLGDQGWCNGADTLFVVTEKATYFGNLYERSEPFIDGGMFAMNLVMGLHSQGIASCCKMYVREPQIDKIIRGLLSIPENEIPIILILAGHYPEHSVTSPISIKNIINYEIQ